MKNRHALANAMLWAAAIIASAVLAASAFLSFILLPSLAVLSLTAARRGVCLQRSDLS